MGVFLVAIVIYFKPEWLWFDPLCTVLFSVIVFFTTVPIFKECTRILMEGSPRSKDLQIISEDIKRIPGVVALLELRVWNINESKAVLTAKVAVLDTRAPAVLPAIKQVCREHRIFHSTVELLAAHN